MILVGVLLFIFVDIVCNFLELMLVWLIDGMVIGGGMVVVVGYVLVINMMVIKEVWLFFIIGFVVVVIF